MRDFSPITVVFLLFPNVTQLDLTGPAQVLSRLGNATIHLVWKDRDPVATDAGFPLLPTATFSDIQNADILCIPGGVGTLAIMDDILILDWLRSIAASAQWVTSVCTGSLLLGAAGLLDGYRATSHWASHSQLRYFGAIPEKARIVVDRNRVTGGGVTSGIDFALALTAMIRGEAHAKLVQLSIEYDPTPPFNSGTPDTADAETLATYHALAERVAPNREEHLRAIAHRLGFPHRSET